DFVEKSSDVEKILIDLRQKQSKFNEELREYENKKSIADLDSKSLLEKITNVRLELKTYEINLENSNKKIVQAGLDIEHINSEDYEEITPEDIDNKLTDVESKIIRLGAINLAAPEEIEEESKRKEELDSQYNDLTEALE